MKAVILFLLLAFAAPAYAQDAQKPEIDPKLCSLLVEHKPADDVAYKPGVDVHGKPVVEADLNPSSIQPPEQITFLVTVDVARYLGLSLPAGVEEQAAVAAVTYENGVLSINGEPAGGPAEATLRELCGIKKPPQKPKKGKKTKHNQ